ncbi:TadE/TadG family type IV pilus assembly protein [Sphingomonas sp. CD22]|uniref:TadE/TadG family type IV pilus assembly protein n=1 Tax=Sphingomonas sp. CD22 TaxID=3100214 RepID=UPI002ADFA893|nr:TadE/TadG family type IV pilus assembly protein [Sphingomonas sp. CD22]MEA1083132.1 TadE/TadG family type IV pilus assembly protein [Sphingomonas sp. CD22]
MRRRLRTLAADARGATIIEFAMVVPVMLLLIMGLGDIAYQAYLQAVLTGAVQKAGRDGTIQNNASANAGTTLDQRVMSQVVGVARTATGTSSRKSFGQFGYIAAEPFQDNNNNGVYDAATECFTDVNGNGTRDLDPGIAGQGGANDVVVYTMTVQFSRLFPLAKMIGWPQRATISATTILKNQPYATQAGPTAQLVCPK